MLPTICEIWAEVRRWTLYHMKWYLAAFDNLSDIITTPRFDLKEILKDDVSAPERSLVELILQCWKSENEDSDAELGTWTKDWSAIVETRWGHTVDLNQELEDNEKAEILERIDKGLDREQMASSVAPLLFCHEIMGYVISRTHMPLHSTAPYKVLFRTGTANSVYAAEERKFWKFLKDCITQVDPDCHEKVPDPSQPMTIFYLDLLQRSGNDETVFFTETRKRLERAI